MRGGRIAGLRVVGRCALRARPALSIACNAPGGAGRTGIVPSVVNLTLAVLYSSDSERAVDNRDHLERGGFSVPTTCAAHRESRETLSVARLTFVAFRE